MKNKHFRTFAILIIAIFASSSASAQYKFSGRVFDSDSQPLIGAVVAINEEATSTITNKSGYFYFDNLSSRNFTIKISFIGKKTFSKLISLSDQSSIEVYMEEDAILANEIVLTATRAGQKTPVAYVNLDKRAINSRNLGQDLPILMELTPSYVATSDGGSGVGYTNMRIRGADNTRINVTMNGIPVNDSESHGVWWVNMPDLASSIEDIQIQRGVGTSTNGAGAFGATINLRTNQLRPKAYAESNFSFGSFNTQKYNLKAGSGLISDHFTFDARASMISTDGYIDRARADLKSIFLSSSYYSENSSWVFNYINGKENTYQAWNGVPYNYLNNQELRTYNNYNYNNEVDDYNQVHYQLFYNSKLTETWNLDIASFYVRGKGYYEQYQYDQDLIDYGLILTDNTGTSLLNSDLVRQKWLDNHFYGAIFNVNFKNAITNFVIGGGANKYIGNHFGKVIWVQNASPSSISSEYYRNVADKKDYNIFVKIDQELGDYFNIYADFQYRHIEYNFEGIQSNGSSAPGNDFHNFILPKAGLSFNPDEYSSIFASYSRGAREPNRVDYVENPLGKSPRAEYLNDFEAGYRLSANNFVFESILYLMKYQDQLLATGKLNDVGYAERVNIANSYRAGLELSMAWKLNDLLRIDANAAFSKSEIKSFTEYFDDWDTGSQIEVVYKNKEIAFSPNIIASANIEYTVFENAHISWIGKYVGDQYIDNTQSKFRSLDDYFLNNLKFDYQFKTRFAENIEISLMLNNLFNVRYENNAWVYKYKSGDGSYDGSYGDIYSRPSEKLGYYDMAGYFPQAGFNFLVGLRVKI